MHAIRIFDVGRRPRPVTLLLAGGALVVAAACSRNARLADHEVRAPEVGPVSEYGVVVDADAEPWQVAYVLLRAIRDDVLAKDDEARQRALDVELRTCAPDYIHAMHKRAVPKSPATRDETVYETVYTWAPGLAYYVDAFDFDPETAEGLMRQSEPQSRNGREVAQVAMPLLDPGDPAGSVFLMVNCVRENGYWRVASFSFPSDRRPTQAMLEKHFGEAASDGAESEPETRP